MPIPNFYKYLVTWAMGTSVKGCDINIQDFICYTGSNSYKKLILSSFTTQWLVLGKKITYHEVLKQYPVLPINY